MTITFDDDQANSLVRIFYFYMDNQHDLKHYGNRVQLALKLSDQVLLQIPRPIRSDPPQRRRRSNPPDRPDQPKLSPFDK